MTTKEKLKPCPFCGCEATIDEISSYDELRDFDYTVECSDPVCMARECGNARFGAKEFAIEAWNRRHVDAAQSAEIIADGSGNSPLMTAYFGLNGPIALLKEAAKNCQ